MARFRRRGRGRPGRRSYGRKNRGRRTRRLGTYSVSRGGLRL